MDNEATVKAYNQGFIDGWMAAVNQVRLSLVHLATDPPEPIPAKQPDNSLDAN